MGSGSSSVTAFEFVALPAQVASALMRSGALKTQGWVSSHVSKKALSGMGWPVNVANGQMGGGSSGQQPHCGILAEVIVELPMAALTPLLLPQPRQQGGSSSSAASLSPPPAPSARAAAAAPIQSDFLFHFDVCFRTPLVVSQPVGPAGFHSSEQGGVGGGPRGAAAAAGSSSGVGGGRVHCHSREAIKAALAQQISAYSLSVSGSGSRGEQSSVMLAERVLLTLELEASRQGGGGQ